MNASCKKHEIDMEKVSIKRLEDTDYYLFKCTLCGPNHGVIINA